MIIDVGLFLRLNTTLSGCSETNEVPEHADFSIIDDYILLAKELIQGWLALGERGTIDDISL